MHKPAGPPRPTGPAHSIVGLSCPASLMHAPCAQALVHHNESLATLFLIDP